CWFDAKLAYCVAPVQMKYAGHSQDTLHDTILGCPEIRFALFTGLCLHLVTKIERGRYATERLAGHLKKFFPRPVTGSIDVQKVEGLVADIQRYSNLIFGAVWRHNKHRFTGCHEFIKRTGMKKAEHL